MQPMDLRGLNPAPVTAFNRDGSLDMEANVRIAKWLASFDEVKSLVILGHAGEGTFLTTDERLELIRAYKDAVDIPIIAGITGEGTKVAAEESKRSLDAGATALIGFSPLAEQAHRPHQQDRHQQGDDGDHHQQFH